MRVVMITGVSRGLGRALAEQLLRTPDTRVVGIGRTLPELGVGFSGLRCDLADPGSLPSVDELRREIAEAGDAALVLNAAQLGPVGAIGTLDAAAVARACTIDFTSALALTDAFVAATPASARVRAVFVSSGAAHRVIDGWSVYSSAKRGVEEFFTHLSEQAVAGPKLADGAPRLIASVVNPGVMDTGMQADVRAASFAGQERFRRLHAEGQLPDPVRVARRLISQHLISQHVPD